MNRRIVNGIELSFVDRGSGAVVVLVHGFPLDHTMWNAQIEALSQEYRVVAPDLRGLGQSGVSEGTVSMEQFADDLAGLLDALEVKAPVAACGLSMGGYVVFQFWRKYASRTAALILCDTRAKNDTPQMAAGRRGMAGRILREGPQALVDTMMPKLFAEASLKQHPEIAESLHRVMMGGDPAGIAAAALGMAERADVTPMLGQIGCPTLVIVGEHDAFSTADEMRSIAGAIGGARFLEIAGCGHMSPMEKPAEVNQALLEFLGECFRGAETRTGS